MNTPVPGVPMTDRGWTIDPSIMGADIAHMVTSAQMSAGSNWGVGVLLIDPSNGKFLMCHRSDTHELASPGGKVEVGESPVQAVFRECLEETNIKLRTVTFYDINAFTAPSGKDWVSWLFVSTDFDAHDIRPQPGEMDDYQWMTFDQILAMYDYHKLFHCTETAFDALLRAGVFRDCLDGDGKWMGELMSKPYLRDPNNGVKFVEAAVSASQVSDSCMCAFSQF